MHVKNIIVCSSKQNYCIDTFFLLHRILNHKKMDIESRIIYMQKFTSASSLLFQYRYEALGETILQNKCIGSLRNKRFALSLFDLGKSKNIVDIFAKMQTEKVKKNTWQAFSCHPVTLTKLHSSRNIKFSLLLRKNRWANRARELRDHRVYESRNRILSISNNLQDHLENYSSWMFTNNYKFENRNHNDISLRNNIFAPTMKSTHRDTSPP